MIPCLSAGLTYFYRAQGLPFLSVLPCYFGFFGIDSVVISALDFLFEAGPVYPGPGIFLLHRFRRHGPDFIPGLCAALIRPDWSPN